MKSLSNRIFIRVWIIVLAIILSGMAILNIYYNPWGNYGEKGVFALYNARLKKTQHLENMPNELLPQALVLGSSNSMRFRPEMIDSLWGLQAFNFGVFWGRTDDMLCITDFVTNNLKAPLRTIFLCIDTWSMIQPPTVHPVFPSMRRRMLNTPELRKYHPSYNKIKFVWSLFIDLFNGQQTLISWEMFTSGKKRKKLTNIGDGEPFDSSGCRIRYRNSFSGIKNIFKDVESSSYNITSKFQKDIVNNKENSILISSARNFSFNNLSVNYIDYLKKTLDVCTKKNISIVIIQLPKHPLYQKYLLENPDYIKNITVLQKTLNKLKNEYPVIKIIYDATDISKYNGDPNGFYDRIHPATRISDSILVHLKKEFSLP